MDYEQSVDYFTHASLFGAHKNGLQNMQELMRRLDNPQHGFRSVHVAGTNGKGSVCAYIDSVFSHAGYRTGLYTSPYLQRFTERIRIDGKELAPEAFAAYATRVRRAAEAMVADGMTHPTFFELTTAAGFLAFAEAGLDLAVVETGMGGRLDATNVLEPLVTVITAIGMDHGDILGPTLADIAREKAGIIKSGVPAVVYPQPDAEAWAEILSAARERQTPLYSLADCRIVTLRSSLLGQAFSLRCQSLELGEIQIALLGRHQALNAATAALACVVLAGQGDYRLGKEPLLRGLWETKWPGRLELVGQDPYVLLDGAHNPQGMDTLVRALEDLFPGGKAVLVCGMLRTKDCAGMIRRAAAVAQYAVVTAPDTDKAAPLETLKRLFDTEHIPAEVVEEPSRAFNRGLQLAREQKVPLVICGSLYLVGAARTWFCR